MMASLDTYFTNIVNDFDHLIAGHSATDASASDRVVSLALRVFGGCFAVSGFAQAIACITTPTVAFAAVPAVFLTAVVAHDLIVMGNNIRSMCNAADLPTKPQPDFFSFVGSFGRAVFDVVPAAWYESSKDIPYMFRNTILFEKVVAFFKL